MTRHHAMTCDSCGASMSNGLALCEACQGMLVMLLEYVPIYFRNLARWRPSTGASDRRSSKSRRLVDDMVTVLETGRTRHMQRPTGIGAAASTDRIGTLLDESHAEMVGWLRALADDRPHMEPVIARILTLDEERVMRLGCALLTKRVATLTTLPWVGDLMHGVRELERDLREATEKWMPGWYAGACLRCGEPTYVVPGLRWVTCQGIDANGLFCGTTTAASDHVGIIIEEARGRVVTAARLAEALVALVDTEHSVSRLFERIVKWGARGKVTAIRDTARDHVFDGERIVVATVEVGRARYRLGEVYDRLMIEGATRTTERIRA